jgi:hypothetical protein
MAKNRRKPGLDTKHATGSYKKKPGPKPSSPGKRVNKRRKHLLGASHFASWKSKIPKLIASLALERGESMDAGEARMALYTTLTVIEEAQDLKFDMAGE